VTKEWTSCEQAWSPSGSSMSELTWWQARALAQSVLGVGPCDQIPLTLAEGRTLARDVTAKVDLPGFATAAMDGWVVAGPGPWMIVGTVDTGTPSSSGLGPGQAMRIATGGSIPAGGESVIPWEIAGVEDHRVVAEVPDKLHIRPQGEECGVGDVLARAGDVLNPALIGSLAAAGLDDIDVVRPLTVSALVLGDEVIESGLPGPGQVRDALGVQIPGWVRSYGCETVATRRVADDLDSLAGALDEAAASCDVVIATGGTARGHRDFLRAALDALGARMTVDGVAVRPGHPMTLAKIGEIPVVGLPGNPLSALVAMVTLVEPMVDAWHGRIERDLAQVVMAEDIPAFHKPLTRLMVGRRELGGFRQVELVSSAMLRGIAHADGWAVIDQEGARKGDAVPWIPVPWRRVTSR